MQIPDWLFSNAVMLAVLGVAVWLSRNYLVALIAQSVKADFDKRIEELRSQLRLQEELYRSSLRVSELQISNLRENALANARNTQAALVQRRLQAVDDLWSGVTDWQQFSGSLLFMLLITSDGFMDELKRGDARTIVLAETMLGAMPKKIDGVGAKANGARPYVSDLAWGLYVAYVCIFGWSVLLSQAFKPREAGKMKLSQTALTDVLVKALPDMKDYIVKSGTGAHYHLTDVLRERILVELKATLAGKEQDAESISRAADIIKAAEAARRIMDQPLDAAGAVRDTSGTGAG